MIPPLPEHETRWMASFVSVPPVIFTASDSIAISDVAVPVQLLLPTTLPLGYVNRSEKH